MSQEKKLDGVLNTVNDMLEIVHFMRDNMATKEDLKSFATKRDIERCATKQDLETMNSNLVTHIDGFVGMHKGLDLELVSLRSKYQRLESHVQQLAKHTSLKLE
jgi:hypothetical protein